MQEYGISWNTMPIFQISSMISLVTDPSTGWNRNETATRAATCHLTEGAPTRDILTHIRNSLHLHHVDDYVVLCQLVARIS